MSRSEARISEAEMADVVKKILSRQPNKSATFAELRDIVPKRVRLSKADNEASPSRPGEEVWVQIVRNLVAHKREGFVSVKAGVRLQWVRRPKAARKANGARESNRVAA